MAEDATVGRKNCSQLIQMLPLLLPLKQATPFLSM
jgi:hypothetical protein